MSQRAEYVPDPREELEILEFDMEKDERRTRRAEYCRDGPASIVEIEPRDPEPCWVCGKIPGGSSPRTVHAPGYCGYPCCGRPVSFKGYCPHCDIEYFTWARSAYRDLVEELAEEVPEIWGD